MDVDWGEVDISLISVPSCSELQDYSLVNCHSAYSATLMDYLITLLTSQRCIACSFQRRVRIPVSLLSILSRNYYGLVMKRSVYPFIL